MRRMETAWALMAIAAVGCGSDTKGPTETQIVLDVTWDRAGADGFVPDTYGLWNTGLLSDLVETGPIPASGQFVVIANAWCGRQPLLLRLRGRYEADPDRICSARNDTTAVAGAVRCAPGRQIVTAFEEDGGCEAPGNAFARQTAPGGGRNP